MVNLRVKLNLKKIEILAKCAKMVYINLSMCYNIKNNPRSIHYGNFRKHYEYPEKLFRDQLKHVVQAR